MSSESTETSTNSKPMKNKARSAHWPVSFANQVYEVEDDEVLKAEGYENEELNDKDNEEDEEDEEGCIPARVSCASRSRLRAA